MTDNTDETLLANLAMRWREAKRAEALARDDRIRIEQEIIAITGCKAEGSKTHQAGEWKVTVTGKLNRTLDRAAWESIASDVPEHLRPVEYKPSLDLKGLRYLESHHPDIYRRVAEAIVTKPGKPAVEIK